MKKIIVGLVAIVLLAGVIGCSAAPTPGPKPTVTPSATPGGNGTPNIQEFLANAQTGKYKAGDTLRVSASYEGTKELSGGGIPIFFFGPETQGYCLAVEATSSIGEFNRLSKGDKVVIEGKYVGFYTTGSGKKAVLLNWGHVN